MASSDDDLMFITCEVCDLPFTSIATFEQHVKGKKHKKQVKDQKKKKQAKSGDEDSCVAEEKDSDTQDYDYNCELCETTFSGKIPYIQHLKSKHHAKVLRKKKAEDDVALLKDAGSDSELSDNGDADLNEALKGILPEPYGSCFICEKQFTGLESYSQHMKSKSHAKNKNELKLLKKLKAMLVAAEVSDAEEISEEREKEKGSSDSAEGQKKLKCRVCEKVFATAVSFAQHMSSRNHAKKESQNKLLKDLKAIEAELEEDSSSSSSEDEESPEVLTCEICSMVFSGPESLIAHLKSKNHKKALKWKKYLSKKVKSKEDGRAQSSLENKTATEKPDTEKKIDPLAKSEGSGKL